MRWLAFFAMLSLSLISLYVSFNVLTAPSSGILDKALSVFLFLLIIVSTFFNQFGAYYFVKSYGLKTGPKHATKLPTVAVVVTSYNEKPPLLKKTLLSLKKMDYPKSKMNLYLLDDSTDKQILAEMKEFCRDEKIKLVHRTDRKGFKGGALNEFIETANEEFLAIFDADEFLIDPAFLKECLGHFEDDEVAYIQTVKKFDASSTLSTTIDTAFTFFFNCVQPVRSSQGFPMFCGSCGILKISSLKKVGGFPDSVTEDAAFSLVADSHGLKGVYVQKVYALGKGIEKFTEFCAQQWRYNFGNTKLFRQYLEHFPRISFGKQFHYLCHIFGLHYLSIVFIMLALVTIVLTFSDYRSLAASLPLITNQALPSLNSLTFKIELLGTVSILSTLASMLIISKLYFNSFLFGFYVYLSNFAIAFVRAKAAVSALFVNLARFKGVKREESEGHSFSEALRGSVFESIFAVLFFFTAYLAILRGDIIGTFWLGWYGVLFSTTFVFLRKYG